MSQDIARAGKTVDAQRVFVVELCGKVFSSILQTVEDWQKTVGSGPQHRSRLMCWCVDMVTDFITRFGATVCAGGNLVLVGVSVATAQDYSNALRKKGICLDFVVNRALFGPVSSMMVQIWRNVTEAVRDAVVAEDWAPVPYHAALRYAAISYLIELDVNGNSCADERAVALSKTAQP